MTNSGAIGVGPATLVRLGFQPTGPGLFVRDGVTLQLSPLWWTLIEPDAVAEREAGPWLGRPGPWRVRGDGAAGCDLPIGLLCHGWHDDDPDDDVATMALEWAMATRRGTATSVAEAPPVVEPERLTVQVGAFACTGEVVAQGDRLWVDFPVGTVPGDLSSCRRRWLERLIAAAGSLRMARVGIDESNDTVRVRADLSGAPRDLTEALMPAVIDVLRGAATWLLPGVCVLTDATVSSRALKLGAVADLVTVDLMEAMR